MDGKQQLPWIKIHYSIYGHIYPPPASASVPWPGEHESHHLTTRHYEYKNNAWLYLPQLW